MLGRTICGRCFDLVAEQSPLSPQSIVGGFAEGSVVVERAHLYGQDLKFAKSRDLAKIAESLGVNRHVRSVVRGAEVLLDAVEEDVAKGRGVTAMVFRKMLCNRRTTQESEISDAKLDKIVKLTQ